MSAIQKEGIYIPHFINARNDRKIKRLRKDMGPAGYAYFFMTLEILREQVGFKYPLHDIDLLADDIGASVPMIETMIRAYDLFKIDENEFFSPKLIQYIQPYLAAKNQRTIAGKISAQKRKEKQVQQLLMLSPEGSTERPLNENLTAVQQNKIKEIKENEKKLNKTLYGKKIRDIFKDLKQFKSHFIQKNTNIEFCTQGIGYESSTKFKVTDSGYLVNMVNNKILTKEEAFKVWEFLFNYYLEEAQKELREHNL